MAMTKCMRIGDLARAAAVPVSTIRYYERKALLRPTARTEARYRLYAPAAVERLLFIRSAQAVGFTLRDIRMLLDLQDGHTARCGEVRPVIERRLAEVTARIEEFREFRRTLERFVDICRRSAENDSCPVFEKF